MNEKMKVWECNGCNRSAPCIISAVGLGDNLAMPAHCLYNYGDTTINWHETTRFVITERQPDYEGMAKKGNVFGEFYDDGSDEKYYGFLKVYCPPGYSFGMGYPVKPRKDLFQHFTPCAEPVELDPITMEPINE